MSYRVLIPTNLFYHWVDPWPNPDDPEKGFPAPNTGDVYFNVTFHTLRVFYDGDWHDAQSGSGMSDKYVQSVELVAGTDPPPAGGPTGGIVGSIYIQY